jgi:disulfide bond formation protein DsbB
MNTTRTAEEGIDPNWALLFACWLLAAVATGGSLFFSYVMEFVPCVLCWYQRIFLFPLVLILPVGLFPFDARAAKFGLPLALAGTATAFYQNLLVWGIVPESIKPCAKGVSCSEKYIDLFGFLSIPMLSLLAFAAITAMLIVLIKRNSSK